METCKICYEKFEECNEEYRSSIYSVSHEMGLLKKSVEYISRTGKSDRAARQDLAGIKNQNYQSAISGMHRIVFAHKELSPLIMYIECSISHPIGYEIA